MNRKYINTKSCFGALLLPFDGLKRLLAIAILVTAWIFIPIAGVAKAKEDQIVPEASNARLGGDNQRTRFVVDISSSVGYSVYVLPKPYRVIIDLPEVNFQLPPGQGVSGRGLVTGYRFGLLSPGRSRIVIDASAPVLIQKSFVIPATKQKPARLVVDIVKTDTKTFLKNRKSQLQTQSKAARLAAIPIPVPKPRGSIIPGFNQKTDRSSKKRAKKVKKVIIIDPGHGGIDSGALDRRGVEEKKIVLSVARMLKKTLMATGRYHVLMTRNDDTFIPLRKRVEFARENDGDLFISIHADTVNRSSVRGTTLYTLSEKASDAEAAALAQKENRSDIIAGVDLGEQTDVVTDILIDLVLRETKNHSIFFAQTVVKVLRKITKVNTKPHRFAGFAVLKAPDIPSVLIELGFLSNGQDARLLSSANWRRKFSRAVAKSIDVFFKS